MKIAIIGSGISGLAAAHRLHRRHEIHLFEARPRLGGHTFTLEVEDDDRQLAIDLGFIVYNEKTYPQLSRLFAELGVETEPSMMSFSVCDETTGFEYNGTTVNTLFAQRSNLLKPAFYRMIAGILRFNRLVPAVLSSPEALPHDLTLGELLAAERFAGPVVDWYLRPMLSAIWSADPCSILDFPARPLLTFLDNHGLATVNDRPEWRVVRGGSKRYVERLTAPFADRIRTGTPIERLRRLGDGPGSRGVEVVPAGGAPELFDAVVLATHSDQALALLADPSPEERSILGAIRYQPNDVVLHTDERLLPRRRLARASWNVHLAPSPSSADEPEGRVRMTYLMNLLQNLEARRSYCVTLNRTADIDPGKILHQVSFSHPVFDPPALRAQVRHSEIHGARRTYYCGAYWRYGFHEDGLVSGLEAARRIERDLGSARPAQVAATRALPAQPPEPSLRTE